METTQKIQRNKPKKLEYSLGAKAMFMVICTDFFGGLYGINNLHCEPIHFDIHLREGCLILKPAPCPFKGPTMSI
jgi:hypothetical protein